MVHKSNYEFRKRGYAPLLTSQVSKKKKKNYLENRKRAGTLKNDQSSTAVIYWPIFPQKYQLVRPTTVSLKPVKMDSLRISPEFIRLTVTSPTRKSYEDLLAQMQTPLLKVKIKTLTSSSFTLHIFSDLKQNKKTLVIKHLLKHLVLFL